MKLKLDDKQSLQRLLVEHGIENVTIAGMSTALPHDRREEFVRKAGNKLEEFLSGITIEIPVVKTDGKPKVRMCACDDQKLILINYDMMWHDGDIVCESCGGYIRSYDAG